MPAKRKRQCQSKLSPELSEALAGLVRRGHSLSGAARLLGHSPDTVSVWLARGEGRGPLKPTQRYRDFASAVRRAQEGDVGEKLGRINEAAAGGRLKMKRTVTRKLKDGSEQTTVEEVYVDPDWKADAWLLEKTHGEQFGRDNKGELAGGRPQVVVVLPDNGRGPDAGKSLNPVRRRKEIPACAPADAVPVGDPSLAAVPRIRPDGEKDYCPDCHHKWRLHRTQADGAEGQCCGGACACTRLGE